MAYVPIKVRPVVDEIERARTKGVERIFIPYRGEEVRRELEALGYELINARATKRGPITYWRVLCDNVA